MGYRVPPRTEKRRIWGTIPVEVFLCSENEVPHNWNVSASEVRYFRHAEEEGIHPTHRAEQLKILVSNPHLGISSLALPLLPNSFLILQLFSTRPFS